MNQDEHKIMVRRMAALIAVASVLIAVYVLRLIFLQLVNGESFKAQATNTTDYNFTVTAARGDIVDSAGRRIAASTTSYNVVLSKLLMGDQDLDTMLQKVVDLLEAHGESWNDSLLIGEPDAAGHYSFTAQADSTSDQKVLAAMKDSLGLQQYATADDVMEKLVEDYKLENYSLHWQRVLGGIHYEMQQQAFSNVNNFVMAENVSETTVATIKENSLTLPGVEIVETSTRSYDEGDIIPHVLGRVGKITAEKWKVTDENGQTTYPLREKGYNMNDMIGVSGLEAVYEDELRGRDGVETITRSSDGVIVGTAMTTVPEPGHTVQLTIDSAFQQAVDKALAKNIEMINSTYNTGSSAKAAAGAVVVISTKDGSVLAASNYPNYDQNLFATQYSEYSADPGLPLLRACTPPAPPSSPPWRWRRWMPASSTAIPRSTATVCIPIMIPTAPSAPATATAATSTSSRPSSGAATSSSTTWDAAPPVTSTTPTPTRWASASAPAWRSTRPPAA